MNGTYIGKGYLFGPVGIMKNTLEIGRRWPHTQEQLAFLFRHMACIYTWDSWTQTNVDAILTGCVPFFLNYAPFTPEEIDGSELGIIPRLDRENHVFDLERFVSQRTALITRIAELQASWGMRVKDFYNKVQARFA
jgi:hypothetical protein